MWNIAVFNHLQCISAQTHSVVYTDFLAHPETDTIHNFTFFSIQNKSLFSFTSHHKNLSNKLCIKKSHCIKKASSGKVMRMLQTEMSFNNYFCYEVLSNCKQTNLYLPWLFHTCCYQALEHSMHLRHYSCPSILHRVSICITCGSLGFSSVYCCSFILLTQLPQISMSLIYLFRFLYVETLAEACTDIFWCVKYKNHTFIPLILESIV